MAEDRINLGDRVRAYVSYKSNVLVEVVGTLTHYNSDNLVRISDAQNTIVTPDQFDTVKSPLVEFENSRLLMICKADD